MRAMSTGLIWLSIKKGPYVYCHQHDSEPSDSIEDRKYFDKLSDCYRLEDDSVACG
jgi:hypothetical protein